MSLRASVRPLVCIRHACVAALLLVVAIWVWMDQTKRRLINACFRDQNWKPAITFIDAADTSGRGATALMTGGVLVRLPVGLSASNRWHHAVGFAFSSIDAITLKKPTTREVNSLSDLGAVPGLELDIGSGRRADSHHPWDVNGIDWIKISRLQPRTLKLRCTGLDDDQFRTLVSAGTVRSLRIESEFHLTIDRLRMSLESTKLSFVSLTDGHFGGEELAGWLADLTNLKSFFCVGSNFDDSCFGVLLAKTSVSTCSLTLCPLTDACLPHVAASGAIERLHIDRSSFSSDGLRRIGVSESLRELVLERCGVSSVDEVIVRELMPHCRVVIRSDEELDLRQTGSVSAGGPG